MEETSTMKKSITIGKRQIGPTEPVFIIAEIGTNHNGDFDLAEKLIRAAARCGVDAVKFQTFKAELFYAKSFTGFEERKKLELPYEWHALLKQLTNDLGIEFISTPFDPVSADFLDDLDIPCFKIASSDLNNFPFLEHIAKKGRPILLSTGYSTIGEIEKAVDTIFSSGNRQLVLLHCVSAYPVRPEDSNLRTISTLRKVFDLPIGLSDHTTDSPIAPIAAAALGACVIEKHFTLDRNLPGYDHHMSETPTSLKQLVNNLRTTEQALGTGIKKPIEAELERLPNARRSLYWKQSYASNTLIDEDMVLIIRPGHGLAPDMLEMIRGHRLCTSVKAGALIKMQHIDWREV
jgi:N-acetylneuraminate synthase/N,N'-diacetyllegionaminate synthase